MAPRLSEEHVARVEVGLPAPRDLVPLSTLESSTARAGVLLASRSDESVCHRPLCLTSSIFLRRVMMS